MQDDTWENEIDFNDYGPTTEEDFLQMLDELQILLDNSDEEFCDLLSNFQSCHSLAIQNYLSVRQQFQELSRYC